MNTSRGGWPLIIVPPAICEPSVSEPLPTADIICPTFGNAPRRRGRNNWTRVDIVGTASGNSVGLHRSTNAEVGPVIRIVINAVGSITIDAVAVYPDDLEAD